MRMDFPTLVLSLLSDDWLFFNDDEIAWDGEHHKKEKLGGKIAPLRAEIEESRRRESQLRTSIADLERELAELRNGDGN